MWEPGNDTTLRSGAAAHLPSTRGGVIDDDQAERRGYVMTDSSLNSVPPWGRSLDEYRRMFALTDDDLKRQVVGCADGPASFNAEMAKVGRRVISFDPLYQLAAGEIRLRIESTYPRLLEWVRRNRDAFVWEAIRSPGELGRIRMAAMDRFLADYERGRAQGRYVVAALPSLPVADRQFDLALCSHFLFLYSEQLPLQFHLDCLLEMIRVAAEVRVFPLLDLAGRPSCHLAPVVAALARKGLNAAIERVPYEVQRGGDQMLRIAVRPVG